MVLNKGAFKYWIRRVLGSAVLYRRPFKRPILIFSARRSGSTLLQQMFHSQPGLNFVSEPLNLWYYRPAKYWDFLPKTEQEQFVSLDSPETEARLRSMFEMILAGRMKLHSQWRWWNRDYSFIQDRWVVKVLHANALIEWFASTIDADIVYLVRHPVPNARSIIARQWSPTDDPYLFNVDFRRRHLTTDSIAVLENVRRTGGLMGRYMLEWGLVNLCPLTSVRRDSWITLTYEELICRPTQIAGLLAQRLQLPDPGRLVARMKRPSRSANDRSRDAILAKGPTALLRKAEETLDAEVRRAMETVMGALGLTAYTADSIWPESSLCHFGPLEGDF